MKIVTFNIRCSWDADGINSFIHREGMIIEKIRVEKPDVVCFQEMTDRIYSELRPTLPEYSVIFNQRNSDFYGEGVSIFVRNETMTILGSSFFWLSKTPYVPGSRYENQSKCPRISQCVILRDERSRKVVRISNNHLDHVSDEARLLGMGQVLDYLYEENEKLPMPLFILGDLNSTPASRTIKYCESFEKLPITDITKDSGTTLHCYGTRNPEYKIDYIFTDLATASLPIKIERWTDVRDGIYLSDHYPLCAEVEL